ncbi:30S ribosomal protein S6 [Patescibacteria group bacterium]|nr:30S ribosomal protein S6 [Patescibacteria group bacterium]
MAKETNIYEIGYLLKATLKEEEILAFTEKLRNAVTEKHGLIISEGKTKKETLAYPIKKENNAFFSWIKFSISTETSAIKEIKKYLEKQNDVLRFLIMRATKEKQHKSVIKRERRAKPIFVKTEMPTKEISQKPTEVPEQKETPEDIKIKEEEIDKKIEELLGE